MNQPFDSDVPRLRGERICFVGKLASMSRREALRLVRDHGGTVLEQPSPQATLLVLGEGESLPSLDPRDAKSSFDEATRHAISARSLVTIHETELWQRLGLLDLEEDVRQLYTPAMLAELLRVPVSIIRRWHRRGLILHAKEVRRLAYFSFVEMVTARRLAELWRAGVSGRRLEKRLADLARQWPDVVRPLAQPSLIVRGRELLLRRDEVLMEPSGQMRFDFDAPDSTLLATSEPEVASPADLADESPLGVAELCQRADDLEESGQLPLAAETLRAALAAGGPDAEICFRLAELLYRAGDTSAARERYFMAIELDEGFVEARANLGCVLAELGQKELAVAAFQGALAFHPDYSDAHLHLAQTLDELGQADLALAHWRRFLELAPNSPWSEIARQRMQ